MMLEDLPDFTTPADNYISAIKDMEDNFAYFNEKKTSYPWGRAIIYSFRKEMVVFAML